MAPFKSRYILRSKFAYLLMVELNKVGSFHLAKCLQIESYISIRVLTFESKERKSSLEFFLFTEYLSDSLHAAFLDNKIKTEAAG